jgi:hypothetical protein
MLIRTMKREPPDASREPGRRRGMFGHYHSDLSRLRDDPAATPVSAFIP